MTARRYFIFSIFIFLSRNAFFSRLPGGEFSKVYVCFIVNVLAELLGFMEEAWLINLGPLNFTITRMTLRTTDSE